MSKGRANGISSMRTIGAFLKKGTCSETLCHVLNGAFVHPMRAEERATAPLAGGIMMHGYQCGQLWGAALAAGAAAYRAFGAGGTAQATAIRAAQRVVAVFRAQNTHVDCSDITEFDAKSSHLRLLAHFIVRGGPVPCLRIAARYAPVAFEAINAALSEAPVDAPAAPVGCAALLARRTGASEMHTAMAAGLAGGIGLSGGACGALGTAIWLTGLRSLEQGAATVSMNAPEAAAVVDRFLKCTDYEFECSTIVGRAFDSVADHACHVSQGGCARIVDTLAAASPSAKNLRARR